MWFWSISLRESRWINWTVTNLIWQMHIPSRITFIFLSKSKSACKRVISKPFKPVTSWNCSIQLCTVWTYRCGQNPSRIKILYLPFAIIFIDGVVERFLDEMHFDQNVWLKWFLFYIRSKPLNASKKFNKIATLPLCRKTVGWFVSKKRGLISMYFNI